MPLNDWPDLSDGLDDARNKCTGSHKTLYNA